MFESELINAMIGVVVFLSMLLVIETYICSKKRKKNNINDTIDFSGGKIDIK